MSDDFSEELAAIAKMFSTAPRGLAELRALIASLPAASPLTLPGVSDTALPSTDQQTAELASGPITVPVPGSSGGGGVVTPPTSGGTPTPGSISGGSIMPGTLQANAFASSIRPIQLIAGPALPSLPDANFPEGSVIFNLSDGRLYRNEGSDWRTFLPETGLANILLDPTWESIDWTPSITSGWWLLGWDWQAQTYVNSGSPGNYPEFGSEIGRDSPWNQFSSVITYINCSGNDNPAWEQYTVIQPHDSTVAPVDGMGLGFLVAAVSFMTTWSANTYDGLELTIEVYDKTHSELVAWQTVDLLTVVQGDWYEINAVYDLAGSNTDDVYMMRINVWAKKKVTSTYIGHYLQFAEPKFHFSSTPDVAPFMPALGHWIPNQLASYWDSEWPLTLLDSGGLRMGAGSGTVDVSLERTATKTYAIHALGDWYNFAIFDMSSSNQPWVTVQRKSTVDGEGGFRVTRSGEANARARLMSEYFGEASLRFGSGGDAGDWRIKRTGTKTVEMDDTGGNAVSFNVVGTTTSTHLRSKGDPWYDVKAYGAHANGSDDDVAHVQSAIDAAYAAGGGIVYFPPGDYLIGTPGLALAESCQVGITLLGAGVGGSPVSSQSTRLVRNGTHAMLTASGTGTTSATKSHGLQVHDLTMDGADYDGDLVVLNRAAAGIFTNVRLVSSGRKLLTSNQLHNYKFVGCNFETSGDAGTSTPAIYLGCPDGTEQTATVMFSECTFEANAWDDIHLDGTSGRKTLGVEFHNCKWERNVAGRCLYFKDSQYCKVVGGNMSQLYSNSQPMVEQAAGEFNSLIGVHFLNYEVAPTYPTTADYAVKVVDGDYFTIVGCSFWGAKTAHIRLDSGAGQVAIEGNMHDTAGASYTALALSDARTNGSRGVILPFAGALGGTTGNERLLSSIGGAASTNQVSLGTRLIRAATGSDWTTAAIRLSMDVDSTGWAGAYLDLLPGGAVNVNKLAVNNSASATTPGSCVKKIEVFDANGASLGFIPVYSTIT